MKSIIKFGLNMRAVAIATASAQAHTLWVESNRADQNSLLAFEMSANGSLKAQVPTMLNGKGIIDPSLALWPFDSDQQVIVSKSKKPAARGERRIKHGCRLSCSERRQTRAGHGIAV